MMINIIIYYPCIVRGGGQKVMIEIVISINDENDERPLTRIGI